jgi:hypothetical protein
MPNKSQVTHLSPEIHELRSAAKIESWGGWVAGDQGWLDPKEAQG